MLISLFDWLDGHAWSYWVGAIAATALLWWRVVRTMRHSDPVVPARWREGVVDGGVLLLFLLAWRWPFLLTAREFNPDESQLIAGAITLVRDPVFWRSVDGTTSGPLNFYVLLPVHWIGLPLDFFTARLVGLLLVWGSLLLCRNALRAVAGSRASWLAVLPAVGFFATVFAHDFVHFSSEHVVLLLVALAGWGLVPRTTNGRWRTIVACVAAGAAPWAKLQVAPLSVVLVGWALFEQWPRGSASPLARARACGLVLGSALAPSVLIGVLIGGFGQTDAAVHRYLLNNLTYAGHPSSMGEAMRLLASYASVDRRFPLLLATIGLLVAIPAGALVGRRRKPSTLELASWALTFAAVLAVIAPRRSLAHYVLLLPVPLTLLVGATLVGARDGWLRSRRLMWCALAAVALPPIVTRCLQPLPEEYVRFAEDWKYPRSSAALLIRALARPGDYLGVWGWASNLYVETGLPQATRDPHSFWAIEPGAHQARQRADYLADFRAHRPAVFVDAVGPGAFGYRDRWLQGHESFPELGEEVRQNYTLVHDFGSSRVYARRGLETLAAITSAQLAAMEENGYLDPELHGVRPGSALPEKQTRWEIDGRNVPMLDPPAQLEWRLDANVRRVRIEFGFAPRAYLEGKTNGADLYLELIHEGVATAVWHRFLDPRGQPLDRGPQNAQVELPDFQRGDLLRLRTGAGPFGDASWDWVYLGSIEFFRTP